MLVGCTEVFVKKKKKTIVSVKSNCVRVARDIIYISLLLTKTQSSIWKT